MLLLGIFCFIYYTVISIRMGKWNSTFAGFWPLAGIGALSFHMVLKNVSPQTRMWMWIVCMVLLAVFIIVEGLIIRDMSEKQSAEIAYIVVLGAQVDGYRITDSLVERLDKATEYLKSHPQAVGIVSGGQGPGELVAEAEAMRKYLVERQGIAEGRIFTEDKSTTTKENLQYSASYISDRSVCVGIVTNNYHMYRAKSYARRLGYGQPCGIPAKCDYVMLPNYMAREFFALWKMWLFY